MRIKYLSLAVVAGLLSACNSSSERTGHLLDAAVSGASYHSTARSGVTGANGEFSYLPDQTVTFTVGGITLGSAQGGETLLLAQLDGGLDENGQPSRITINRAIFLQSIDEDHDPTNGIQIDSAMADDLKGTTLNFDQDSSAFSTELGSMLGAETVAAEDALDHLLVTETETKGNIKVSFSDGIVESVQRFVVPDNRVAYPGSDAGLKKIFPNGFPLAVGSGLAFDSSSNGTLTFYGITDRGPNADSPILLGTTTATKVFPVPNFAPTIVKLTVDTAGSKGVVVSDAHELNRNGSKISGRPVQSGTGSSGEVALDETLTHTLAFDPEGMDTEALVKDPQDSSYAWTCDEYGPFVAKIKLATGEIVRKYSPGVELPAVIAKRQPNRGCEGLAMTPNGKIYAMVQSTLDVPDANNKSVKDKALFTRIVEIDRSGSEAAPTTKTFAYPLNPADWQDAKSGKAKLGDLVAVDDTHFLIMEQGAFADGNIHNKIFLVDISGATDISNIKNGSLELETATTVSDLMKAGVTRARKTLIGDMRDYGWILEKAEGLALVDNQTIALINDDDFGLGTDTHDANNVVADPTKLFVDTATGAVTDGNSLPYSYKVSGNDPSQRRTQLWLIKLAKPVLDFQQDYSYVQAGDLLQAPLKDFHPTQPAIGKDQIYYKLGRYAKNLDSPNKKFDDYCEDMGQASATKATVNANSRLDTSGSFACKDAVGKTLTSMKSAVIGPQGKLYLTDGHHSFTSYRETPDGGLNMKVWVRVIANYSNLQTMDAFWNKMKANNYVWLKDGGNNNAAITPDQLPSQLGLANFSNDPYRSLIYFTRDIGYSQPVGGTEFLEFYWGDWMRSDASGLGNITSQMTDFQTYLGAVQTAANAMVALQAGSVVSGGKTTVDLGKLDTFNSSEYTKLSQPINNSKPGKLAYALDYKSTLP